ncbi:S1/P1 nuclease [Ideonella sp. DXS29W]|uniref:S1/P1 nuclease n=1 Tax=Ideonella lacteola TaxID=2984193 RepID=A0ABU9BWA3_9BURK
MITAWPAATAAAILAFGSAGAFAWGNQGHQVIASVAAENLSAPAKRSLHNLLAAAGPDATVESLAIWPDTNKSPATARWHYVNIDRAGACHYVPARDCKDGQCVVEAVTRQMAVLSSAAPAADRARSLAYVLHLVADAHQPLHAGWSDDRGGNQFQLQAFGRGTNLHALWDTGLIEHWNDAGSLKSAVSAASRRPTLPASATPAQWVEESCRLVATPGFYPDAHRLPADYATRWQPVMVERMGLAAARLSAILEAALAGPDAAAAR